MSQQSLNSLAPEFMHNRYDNSSKAYCGEYNHMDKKMSPEDYQRFCKKMSEKERCHENAKACEECKEVVKCEDPCEKSCFDMGWLGLLLLWFIVFTVLFWLIYYSLNPAAMQNEDGTVNTGKVLLASIISSIILVIIIWLIKSCIDYSR